MTETVKYCDICYKKITTRGIWRYEIKRLYLTPNVEGRRLDFCEDCYKEMEREIEKRVKERK